MTKVKQSKRTKHRTHRSKAKAARAAAKKGAGNKGSGKRSTPAKSRARSSSDNGGDSVSSVIGARKVRAKTGNGPRVLIHARIRPDLRDKMDSEYRRLGLPNVSAMVEVAVERYFG